MYTLFGYQLDPNKKDLNLDAPVDLGQFHTSGYTEYTLSQEFFQNGFYIKNLYRYDGWSTPSIFVEAVKGSSHGAL